MMPLCRESVLRLEGASCGGPRETAPEPACRRRVSARGQRPLKRAQSKTQGGTVCIKTHPCAA